MKIARTFRLSEEAINKLNEQENATEFLEALILDKYTRPLEVVPLKQLYELLEEQFSKLKQPPRKLNDLDMLIATSPQATKAQATTTRSPKDVLKDIEDAKANLADFMLVNQDPQDHAQEQAKIQALWDEYHALNDQ
jgi:hypothetical protein